MLRCPSCHALSDHLARTCHECGGELQSAHRDVAPRADSDADPTADTLKAATAGEYEIIRKLGRGGFATVYLGYELALGRYVAIKVLAPELLSSPDVAERFRREAVTVANLLHPHIVTIYSVRQAGALPFQTMEFVRGRALDTVLRASGPLRLDLVRAILYQVGSALAYAHRRGVVHRDIKPANILLDTEGRVVVTDFGIAKILAEATGLTTTGSLIGTPYYMSPEQCDGRPLTGASDQYSLGVVAYEIVTGAVPFTGTPLSVMRAHAEFAPPPIQSAEIACPADLEGAIMRMLAKSPTDRWPSMADALAALGAAPMVEGDPAVAELAALAAPEGEDPHAGRPLTPAGLVSGDPSSVSGGVSSNPPRTLVFEREPRFVTVEERTLLRARALDAGGTHVPATVHWSSSDPSVLDVTAGGEIIGRRVGSAVITARAGTITRSLNLSVRADQSRPSEQRPPKARWRRLGPIALWGVGMVALGLIFYPSIGPGDLSGPTDESPVAARVELQPSAGAIVVGDSARLRLLAYDASGSALTAAPGSVRWSSSDTSVVKVSSSGDVVGVGEGTAAITAVVDSARGVARFDVGSARAAVATVELGNDVTLVEGDQHEFRTVVRDEAGSEVVGRSHRWSLDDTTRARIDATGSLVAHRAGRVTVRVDVEGQTDAVTVTITARVASIRAEPAELSMQQGETGGVRLTLLDRDGLSVAEAGPIQWRGGGQVASVNASGSGWIVSALAPGQVELVPTAGGVTGSVMVRVAPAIVMAARIVLPRVDSLTVGDSVRLAPEVVDRDGNLLRRVITWRVVPDSVAQIGAEGLLRARAPGRATVIALADGAADTVELTVAPAGPAYVRFARLAAGGGRSSRACGISDARTAYCWGNDGIPTLVPITVEQISVGFAHTCAVSTAGGVYCWGENGQGQIGDGSTEDRLQPTPVEGPSFVSVAVGGEHTCGVTVGGAVHCWGGNRNGQVGDASGSRSRDRPREVRGNEPFQAVVAGGAHTCGLARGGRAYCWGDGYAGQVGAGASDLFREPYPVDGDLRFRALAAGREHTCGLTTDGAAYCWGKNDRGQLGDGTDDDRYVPVRVSTSLGFVLIVSGDTHACGLTAEGRAHCWGEDFSGVASREPMPFAPGSVFQALAAGQSRTCGLTIAGEVLCWGTPAPGEELPSGGTLIRIER